MPRTLRLEEAQRILGVEGFGCTSLHCPSEVHAQHEGESNWGFPCKRRKTAQFVSEVVLSVEYLCSWVALLERGGKAAFGW